MNREEGMSKEKVLIVEDEEDILQLLSFNVEAAGYEVISSSDGYEACTWPLRTTPN